MAYAIYIDIMAVNPRKIAKFSRGLLVCKDLPRSKRFEDRTKKLHRLLAILRILDNRARCAPQSLAQKFDTTERNIYRDIKDLNSSGFAITFDREQNTYRFTDPDFTLRDLDLTSGELMALLLGNQIAHNLGKPFENGFKSLLKKAHKDTATETQTRIKRLEGRKQFWVDIYPLNGFEGIEKQYNAIMEAMNKRQEVEIVYEGMHEQKETRRRIAPYGLFFTSGMWYVHAHCNLRNEIRSFALDCIKEFKITEKPYIIPQDFSMDDYFKSGWHIIQYGEPVEVVLKFAKECARWIKRKNWHPTQVIEEREDGSIIFKVTVQGTKELKWWTYHWIPYCEILSPPELRREVMEEMRGMLKVYKAEMAE